MLANKADRHAVKRPDLAAGDTVVVVAGKDRGKRGRVLRTLPDQGKIVVEGVNILKRHTKANDPRRGGRGAIQGGIVDFESPFAYSNVMLVCPSCDKPTRIRHSQGDDGRKRLVCVSCGEPYERVRSVESQ
jgi:large subunit ribosomal protein L24